jgi:AraC family transcriptional regulator
VPLTKVSTGGTYENSTTFNHTPSITARTSYFYVQSTGHFFCSDDYHIKRDGYKSLLLIYTLRGKGYAKYRGRHYEMRPGDALLIDCFEYQEYYSDASELWEIKWLHFYGSTSEEYFKLIYENFGPVISIGLYSQMVAFLDTIMNLKSMGVVQFEIKASCIILQMLTEIMLSAHTQLDTSNSGSQNCQVEKVLSFIEENYTKNITLLDISRVACSSPYHFSRVFKKVTGFSPYEYLIKYIINKAKTFLRASELPVNEIAVQVGFESSSNFIKTFRELEHITPLKYRKFWTRL